MALAPLVFGGRTITDFETAVNDYLAANLSTQIESFSFTARNIIERQGIEHQAGLMVETAGAALTDPFIVKIFQTESTDTLSTSIETFLGANPTIVFTKLFLDYLKTRRILRGTIGCLIYSVDGGAAGNWNA